ncbi:pyrroline-5-carboxylate reductase [Candidatus Bathyarchaeota archaeon ex4484_205]|nr:MAG: pyrroline-5-carboxylate reductase [Candidatus Bathyarchaeota archaeon ex4484_205]HDN17635.1 pyrroline-5-carboxylate reductase [Candidatus Bathyarchaeota archaeon]
MKIGIIGIGTMGSSIASAIVDKKVVLPKEIYLIDKISKKAEEVSKKLGTNFISKLEEIPKECNIIIIAVKPRDIWSLLRNLAKSLTSDHLLISIVAGIHTSEIEKIVGRIPVVRVMPNHCLLLASSASAYSLGKYADEHHSRIVEEIFSKMGLVVKVDEREMDVVTGLSGCGPAYFYLVIESLADGAVKMGLDKKTALKLAAQTAIGAGKMVIELGLHPSILKDTVATPGGATIRGLHILESHGVRSAFIEAVESASLRSKELRSLHKS